MTWTDTGVHITANLAKILQLPGTSLEKIKSVRDKSVTREVLAALPEANPAYRTGQTVEDLERAIAEIGIPCLIKYPEASGGRGIVHVNTRPADYHGLLAGFRQCCDYSKDSVFKQNLQSFIVEEKIIGSEHSVAGLVKKGKISIFAIIDKKIDLSIPYQYQSTIPSLLDELVQKKIVNISRNAIKLSGIDNCGFHVDIMVRNGTVYILEIGGRLGGECINSHLIPLATGDVDPYEMVLSAVTGNGMEFKECYIDSIKQAASMLSIYSNKPGRIHKLKGIGDLKKLPGVVDTLETKAEGDSVYLPSQKYNSLVLAFVILRVAQLEEAYKLADQCNEQVSAIIGSNSSATA